MLGNDRLVRDSAWVSAALGLAICAVWLLPCIARAGVPPASLPATAPVQWDTYSDTWVATDALGRSLPTEEEVGPPRPDRTVGMFYFLWIDGRGGGAINDNAKILAQNPDLVFKFKPEQWHWWAEPLFGYYLITDPFIIRKHAEMLTDAGVDAIIFDSSNREDHLDQAKALCDVYRQVRGCGTMTPQITFLTNKASGKMVQRIYDGFYGQNLYPELWLQWDGKPLMLYNADPLSSETASFFTFRHCWAWSKAPWFADGHDKWCWLDDCPQKASWHDRPENPEELSVCIAQHATTAIGRSFHDQQEPQTRQPEQGLCFDEQWKRALAVNPKFVFVTGWNEWIARMQPVTAPMKFLGRDLNPGDGFFVDEYNSEFSRDIEPVKGELADNYYYQLIANIRRYKGVRALPPVVSRMIAMDGDFKDWRDVAPEFRNHIGSAVHRDFAGYAAGSHISNQTGRNDLIAAKVCYDDKNVYFYVRAADPITPHTDPNWMMLFIDADQNAKTGWMGYDFVVNRTNVKDGTTTLERNIGGKYQWEPVATIPYQVHGNEMELAIPREQLGIKKLPATIDFKWADNIQQTGDWTDFYLNGDCAPPDRFNYRAKMK